MESSWLHLRSRLLLTQNRRSVGYKIAFSSSVPFFELGPDFSLNEGKIRRRLHFCRRRALKFVIALSIAAVGPVV